MQAVVDYLENTANTGAGRVVTSWLSLHLLNSACHIQESDFRPPGSKSIEPAVLDKLGVTR